MHDKMKHRNFFKQSKTWQTLTICLKEKKPKNFYQELKVWVPKAKWSAVCARKERDKPWDV